MIKTGISTATLYPMLTEDALLTLAKNNVNCVEIFANSHSEIETQFVKGLKKIIDEYRITVSSIHPYTCGIEPMMFFTQYQRRFLDILDYYKKYFEMMNILGANIFVFHGNKPQNIFPDEQYFEIYKALYDLGKSYGITVAQENVARCSCGNLDFATKMSNALGDDVRFVLDTKQCIRSGYTAYDFIDKIGEKIAHIHISDYNDKSDCMLVGKGNLNVDKFIKELKNSSFTGSIILELYSNGYKNINEVIENWTFLKQTAYDICDN